MNTIKLTLVRKWNSSKKRENNCRHKLNNQQAVVEATHQSCYYEIDGLVRDNEYAQLPPLEASELDELLYVISSEEWEREKIWHRQHRLPRCSMSQI